MCHPQRHLRRVGKSDSMKMTEMPDSKNTFDFLVCLPSGDEVCAVRVAPTFVAAYGTSSRDNLIRFASFIPYVTGSGEDSKSRTRRT